MTEKESLISLMRGDSPPVKLDAKTRAAIERELRSRLPATNLTLKGGVSHPVEIVRDRLGIPHIFAEQSFDLFFGLGFAMGQDRLWQMDIRRRKGLGRLAEIFGEGSLPSDIEHRTIALDRLAEQDAASLDDATAEILHAFVNGVNQVIDQSCERLPIEFDLLGYAPEPWTVTCVLATARGFWWQLNGRLTSLVVGEAARRHLPAGPLLDAFMTPEFSEVTIVPSHGGAKQPIGAGSDVSALGSNNWAAGKGRTRSGAGILGSDPHLPFGLPSTWYECRLLGPEDDLAGAACVGMPGLFFGTNWHIAWGITNNNTSLRDLYIEEVDPTDAGRYREGDEWKPFAQRTLEIPIKGRRPVTIMVQETSRGPVVNDLIPSVEAAGDPSP
jgi:penicillin G amidase